MTGPKPLCQDWSCPARVSCARHFGRSAAYATMAEPGTTPLMDRSPRQPGADTCEQYAFDTAFRPHMLSIVDQAKLIEAPR